MKIEKIIKDIENKKIKSCLLKLKFDKNGMLIEALKEVKIKGNV